jgi:hypothetical protein
MRQRQAGRDFLALLDASARRKAAFTGRAGSAVTSERTASRGEFALGALVMAPRMVLTPQVVGFEVAPPYTSVCGRMIGLGKGVAEPIFHLLTIPRSRHRPVAVTDGSSTRNLNKTAVRLWTYRSCPDETSQLLLNALAGGGRLARHM